jgi:hypothetical protein
MEQGEYEAALEDYKAAYEQVGIPDSEIGLAYLEALSRVAGTYWGSEEYPGAVRYYQQIREVLAGADYDHASLQEIWQNTRARLVEYHQHVGVAAYADGEPEDIDQAIKSLEQTIGALVALGTEAESQILADKLRQLKVRKYQAELKAAQAALDAINAGDSQDRFGSEEMFQHYLAIDEAYYGLIELEPGNEGWQANRRQKSVEWVEARRAFALQALSKPEPDYEAALRQYNAMRDIETRCPGTARELNLDLDARIAELQAKADSDGKYYEIMRLIDSKDYARALERLDQEFIQTGNYEHRDAARWFWGLAYAKGRDWNFPPEWDSLSGFQAVSRRLMRVERARLSQLKDRLEPWSKARIFETISGETQSLGRYEERVTDIEKLIGQAVAHGQAESPEVELCRVELAGVTAHIENQRRVFLEPEKSEMAQKVDAWLGEIEEIEALLQTSNPIQDIPVYLERSEEARVAIEDDPAFEMLEALESVGTQIEQAIERVELGIQGRLYQVLVADVGRRDEELDRMQKASAEAEEELARAKEEATSRQAALGEAREEIAELQQQVRSLDRQSAKHRRQYERNRYLVPVALAVALITGGAIASRIETLPGMSIVRWVALVLLVAYFAYYVWVYHFARTDNE